MVLRIETFSFNQKVGNGWGCVIYRYTMNLTPDHFSCDDCLIAKRKEITL